MIEFVEGDLLEAKEKYIAHQTNCVTKRAAHLAKAVFDRFPYADVYTGRTTPNKPGTIRIMGDGDKQRFVINMFGQYEPGKPKSVKSTLDGYKAREHYFHQALIRIFHMEDLQSIAFPYKIGCGAAGGNWNNYLGTLENFSRYLSSTQIIDTVSIYCLTKEDRDRGEAEYRALIPKMMAKDLGLPYRG